MPPTHGQLMVRVSLPPGVPSAGLFLNESFVGELPGGVLPAPLWLLPGGYGVRVSAPALRSYTASVDIPPGQLVELSGALIPESAPPPAPLAPMPAPTSGPPIVVQRRSASQTYKTIVYAIGFSALGLALTAGVITGIVCAAGKCKSSRSSFD